MKLQNDKGLTLLYMKFDLQVSPNLEWNHTVYKGLQVRKQYRIVIRNVMPISFEQ